MYAIEFFDGAKVGAELATMAAKKQSPLAVAPTMLQHRTAQPTPTGVPAMRPSFWGGGGLKDRARSAATAAAKPGVAKAELGVLGRIGGGVARGAQRLGVNVAPMANRLADFHVARGAGGAAGIKALRTVGGGALGAAALGVAGLGAAMHHGDHRR